MKPIVLSSFFTTARCFALMLAFILGCFLWVGADSVLTSWGFETKASLQKSLATETQNRQQLTQANKDLQTTIVQTQKDHNRVLKELQSFQERSRTLEEQTQVLTQSLAKKSVQAKANLKKTQVTTEHEVTLAISDLDTLSLANIEALHNAFDQFSS